MPYRVFLKKHEERRILDGHAWVYANEVDHIDGSGHNGDLASVYDASGRFLGRGFINHLSKILVRIFLRNDTETVDKDFFVRRIREANASRVRLGYSDCYRAVFAESDDLPALIVDKYHDLLCVQILSLGMNLHKKEITDALIEIFSPRGIYERSSAEVRKKEGLELSSGPLYGDFDPRVVIEENGLRLIADLENGQKTGYFLDQKENRFAIRRYSENAEVLDCFCNVGGFSLNAAAAGAKHVIALDISERALMDVRENAALNGLSDRIETVCGDVFSVLREYRAEKRQFDLVVLDPPAFAKTANDVKNAYKGYKDINILGMKLVRKNGFLVTASCSHYMGVTLFEKMLKEAAHECGRRIRVFESRTQAPDHPALLSAAETSYLKFYILQVL